MQKIKEGGESSRKKTLKICCGILVLIIVLLAIVLVSLFFTVLKPKSPILTPLPTKLKNVEFGFNPKPTLNATLDLVITVKNPNRGNFEYQDSNATLDYRGTPVAEITVEHGTVPARGRLNVSTHVDVSGDKIIGNPSFMEDVAAGSLNFSSSAALPGKVKVLRMFKVHATVFMTCDICVCTANQSYTVQSTCNAKIKL